MSKRATVVPHRSRRPLSSLLRRGATSALLLSTVALAGCSVVVQVDEPLLDAADLKTCEELVSDAPETLFGLDRRTVSGATTAVAWGDPAVVLECGADAPEEFDAFSRCSEVAGVGWFMPDDQLKDASQTLVITAQSHSPRVSVTIPPSARQNKPDTQLQALGTLLTDHLTEIQPCK